MVLIEKIPLMQWFFMLNCLVTYSIFSSMNCIKGVTSSATGKCTINSEFNKINRDGKLPAFPLKEDLRVKSSYIYKAHEILSSVLKQFLELNDDADLGTYLSLVVIKINNITFSDEYGQEINSFHEVFTYIWEQYNETLCENYAFKQFDNDKLDLCSVARYLSHQSAVKDGKNLINRMGKALKYKCDPCTPYKRQTNASPEGDLIFCNTTDDFKPCVFSHGDLKCELVPILEIQKVFQQTATNTLKTVTITLKSSDYSIEEDVFASKRISNLVLAYEKGERPVYGRRDNLYGTIKTRMKVNVSAFRSSKSYMRSLEIQNVNGIDLDFSFLTGFHQLNNLTFKDVFNIHRCLPTLPELPNLILLDCHSCSALGEFTSFPKLVNGLKYTAFWPINEYERDGDETINKILNWLLLSSSDSLQYITIERFTTLTKVPQQIPLFKALKHLSLQGNGIETISPGILTFSVPVIYLDLQNNGIKVIEPGAFQGDFKKAYFNVNNNNLDRFEAFAFRRLVQEMVAGRVYARGNPIDCSDLNICNLAWLIRDEKSKLEKKIIEGNCSNGTSFEMLPLVRFSNC